MLSVANFRTSHKMFTEWMAYSLLQESNNRNFVIFGLHNFSSFAAQIASWTAQNWLGCRLRIHRLKWRHSNLWSRYDRHVVRHYVVL